MSITQEQERKNDPLLSYSELEDIETNGFVLSEEQDPIEIHGFVQIGHMFCLGEQKNKILFGMKSYPNIIVKWKRNSISMLF